MRPLSFKGGSGDVRGLKQVETCAADKVAELTVHEESVRVNPLAQPAPIGLLPIPLALLMHNEDDSDDSEDGFGDARLDWYVRAQWLLQARAGHTSPDVAGGASAGAFHGDLLRLLGKGTVRGIYGRLMAL